MATLWKESDSGTTDGFQPMPITDGLLQDKSQAGEVRIFPLRDANRPSHVLVAAHPQGVLVNGVRIVGGLKTLKHRDEICFGGQRLFYSSETTPVVEVYSHEGTGRRPRCPICRAEILDGESIVRCPGCTRVYHQCVANDENATDEAGEKPCWTYSPNCRFCEHPTSLSGEPTWRPEQLMA